MQHMVLLVDDDPNLLSSLQRSLRSKDYQICCATSAEMALRILKVEPIDLIVSDQQMPGLSGTEFLAEVQRRFPDTVRFMLTGNATLDVAIKAINKGAISRFFVKPCNGVDLAISIRQALQQKDLMVQAKRLLYRVQRQSAMIGRIEQENPGITKLDRDDQGVIHLEDSPEDFETFMGKVRQTLGDDEDNG